MLKKLQTLLFEEKDNAPLVLFRMIFGFLIMAEAWGAIATGWVHRAFIEPQHTFPFMAFSWLEPLPGNGMYYYYGLMGLAGIFVMLGLFYRSSMGLYAIMWAGVYFMQKTSYNNHYYLLMLLNFMMVIVPANRYYSMDARRNPEIKSLTCPRWCLLIFAVQITIVYIYASVAKMYPDWIEAKPVHIWFEAKKHYFLVGPLLTKEWFQHLIAWGGIAFDLLIAPALIWKRTRKYAFFISIFFHLFNSAVFQVGIFPYLGIAFGIFFFPPDQIRRLFFRKKPVPELHTSPVVRPAGKLLMAVFLVYFLIQLYLPLRHWLYPGNVNWTEEGHRLSWHMMLRVKSGYAGIHVTDPETGETFKVKLSDYLTAKQQRSIATRPDMMYQFIQILKSDLANKGIKNPRIHVNSLVSLNGRNGQPLYDPLVDFSQVEWKPFRHSDWLVPLREDTESTGRSPTIPSRN